MTYKVDAIGLDDKAVKPSYATQVKKKNPWEDIGNAINGFGTYMSNLPDKCNSAFTVQKGGQQTNGAFEA